MTQPNIAWTFAGDRDLSMAPDETPSRSPSSDLEDGLLGEVEEKKAQPPAAKQEPPSGEPPATAQDGKPSESRSRRPRREDNPFHPANLEKTLSEDESEQTVAKLPEQPVEEGKEPETPPESPESPETPRKYANVFESPEKLEEAYLSLQRRFGQQGSEIGDLRSAIAALSGQAPQAKPGEPPTTQQDQPEYTRDYRGQTDPETGFPLDELGVPVRPARWWTEQRLQEYVEACERDGIDTANAPIYMRSSNARVRIM